MAIVIKLAVKQNHLRLNRGVAEDETMPGEFLALKIGDGFK